MRFQDIHAKGASIYTIQRGHSREGVLEITMKEGRGLEGGGGLVK